MHVCHLFLDGYSQFNILQQGLTSSPDTTMQQYN
uniref:Uncharacterized protein n=1 Tax=Arundo donax TaxID=35708 RepID=A0A0A9GYJ1_ARUDO